MLIKRISQLTNQVHERDVPITEEQLRAWRHGALIQEAMPDLDEEEREFLQTGITPEEWRKFVQ